MIFKGGVGAVLSPSHLKKPVALFCVRRYHTKGILRKIKSCKTALMIWLSKIIPFLFSLGLFGNNPVVFYLIVETGEVLHSGLFACRLHHMAYQHRGGHGAHAAGHGGDGVHHRLCGGKLHVTAELALLIHMDAHVHDRLACP